MFYNLNNNIILILKRITGTAVSGRERNRLCRGKRLFSNKLAMTLLRYKHTERQSVDYWFSLSLYSRALCLETMSVWRFGATMRLTG